MFDEHTLKVGSAFYGYQETNNAFRQRKIHKEFNGETWFKYTVPLRTYKLVEYDVVGICNHEMTLDGRWPEDSKLLPYRKFYVTEYCNEWQQTHVIDIELRGELYHTRQQCVARIAELEAYWAKHQQS